MAQRSKFIGAPSRNEFWEPQEGCAVKHKPRADNKRSGQNRSALQAVKRFWEPQEGCAVKHKPKADNKRSGQNS